MKKITLWLPFICVAAIGQTPQPTLDQFFPIDKGHSYIEFSIKYMGYAKVRGRFADFSGLFRYDERNVTNTSVSLLIKTESIDTDLDFRDNDLKSANWFDSNSYPTIMFKSKSVKKTETGLELAGDLTIKAVTKEITIRLDPPSGILKDARSDLQVIFTGTTSFDRTQFGVEGKNWSAVKEGVAGVASEVTIEFSILGKQLQVNNFTNWVRDGEQPAGKIYKLVKDQGVKPGLAEFKKMVDNQTANKEYLDAVGHMLRLEGRLPDAIAIYEANKDAFPDSGDVYYSLGEAYLMAGDLSKAKANFAEAVKKNAKDVRASEILRNLN